MSWDDDEFGGATGTADGPAAVDATAWDDEDKADDAASDWDASSDEEDKAAGKAAGAGGDGPAAKKKTKRELRLEAERKAADEREAAHQAKMNPNAEKARVRAMQEANDLANAQDLFGGLSVDEGDVLGVRTMDGAAAPAPAGGAAAAADKAVGLTAVAARSELDAANPKTLADYERFADLVAERIGQYQTSTHYTAFLKRMLKASVDTLRSDQIKEVTSFLGAIQNDRTKAERKADGKKTKKKTKKNLGDGWADDMVTDQYDDYDGFM